MDAGGVPLPQDEDDTIMPDALDDVHIAIPSTSPRHETYARDTRDDDMQDHRRFILPSSSFARSTTTRRRSHPRPVTREMLEEEYGRRTRLALEGEPPDRLAEFRPSHAHSTLFENRNEQLSQALSAPQLNSGPAQHETQARVPAFAPQSSRTYQPTEAEIEAAQVVMAIDAQSHELDEDALAVDDPRRNYDFADFMDTWRLHSLCNKRLPSFELGLQSSLRLGRRPDQITRANVNTSSVDMQGIRWQLIGPSRRQATTARAMLHPSGLGATFLPSKQQTTHNAFVGDHERHYQFRATVSRHKANFSHYQLRNVLAASNRNDVFYATGNHVMRASMACPTMKETAMDLSKPGTSASSFRVTCLSTSSKQVFSEYRSDDVLLAGGFCGEYAVLNLDADQRHSEGFVTHAYNGLVTHIHNYHDRKSGNLRAAFCSNDRKVRLMDVSTLRFTDEFSYDNAINCSATAPDGRLRVLVGDTSDTLITDAERGAPIITLKEHNDHGFACAWSKDGRHVATGAQDGSILVWDSRKWSKPLRSLDSVMSCARSLNFTHTGELIVAENDDVVRVYDAGRFDAWQELRFFGSIAGVALVDGGAELAIANADKTVGGLMTFERSSRGVGCGSYGRKVAKAGPNGANSRRGKSLKDDEYVGELLI
ncbi:uncharacterized protein MYCFIDRAFT_216411 [Pseudocercospora fijiensis CIRAD86]|uniref:Uncharacterized protein n=1 Tax=Pseudocercospora fijiensis (strain CIRAD86) TaxID=383855 RepID=M3APH4_PSEFD|nr:uncharacterized protein MYCFIDRAFT_216411 [Pseudocercospora fijiensis CIRAD86]EME79327.1 hypothetical protein MYCFIDRAFT_216411 [Pseudocercospora fijiensis CIRAD86]